MAMYIHLFHYSWQYVKMSNMLVSSVDHSIVMHHVSPGGGLGQGLDAKPAVRAGAVGAGGVGEVGGPDGAMMGAVLGAMLGAGPH